MLNCTLSIIIVNWNSGQLLRECVSSIALSIQDGFSIIQVIVVDNGSSDESLDGVDQLTVPVQVIRNIENRGFAAACNQGGSVAIGDYLLFLNPDTRLFVDSLSKPIYFMQQPSSSRIGICGIRLVDEEGHPSTSAARFPTLRVMTGRTLGLSLPLPKVFPAHLLTSADLMESGIVDQVIGAFFLIRRNVFVRCNGFDERFFVYFEEVDLAIRAKRLGYASYFLSEASAYHKGGGCSESVRASRLFYSLRSRILYAQKHYSNVDCNMLILLTMLELPLRLVQGLLRFSASDVNNTFIAYRQLASYFWRRGLWH
jgi:GT2 family glycosyltransferase